MRILNNDIDKAVSNITLFLTKNEAKELIDLLQDLIASDKSKHHHINDSQFQKEITVAIYGADTAKFGARIQKLIEEDV